MGACATKPTVAKDKSQAPQPPPEPAKEEIAAASEVEQAVAAAVGGEEEKKVSEKEIDHPDGDEVVKQVDVDADKVADDDQTSSLFQEKNGEKKLMEGVKAQAKEVKSENEKIIEPLTQEPSVTGGPMGSEKQVQSLADVTPEEPAELDKSGTEKFVEAPEMLPAETFDSPKGPPAAKPVIDAPGIVAQEKSTEGTATTAVAAQTNSS